MSAALTEERLLQHDEVDALRIVQAVTLLAALPGMVSSAARDVAASRLRDLAAKHPQASDLLRAVIDHLDNYP